ALSGRQRVGARRIAEEPGRARTDVCRPHAPRRYRRHLLLGGLPGEHHLSRGARSGAAGEAVRWVVRGLAQAKASGQPGSDALTVYLSTSTASFPSVIMAPPATATR